MKIVAQSLVPTRPTYIHIAYVAANIYNNGLSLVAFVAISCVILLYQIQNKIKSWKIGITVLTIAAVGYTFFVLMPIPENNKNVTQSRVVELHNRIQIEFCDKNPIPPTVRKMQKAWHLHDMDIQDAWRHDLSVKRFKDGFQVISAGADRRFGTLDDIKWPPDHELREMNEDIKNSHTKK